MDAEIIDISSLDADTKLNLNWGEKSNLKSSNFGGGLELLMNDKVREGSGGKGGDVDLEDLEHLENELNELSQDNKFFSVKSDLFSFGNGGGGSNTPLFSDDREKHSVRFDDNTTTIGKSTAETSDPTDGKTWDGYAKFNNIPLNPDKSSAPATPQLTKEELLREKFKYLRKLEALEKKGVELSKKYNMESPLAEMQGEYETIMDEKAKQNSVKFQGNMMMAIINGIEFLNGRFDPFDIKLDGWGEQLNENITDYDDVFGELFEKYKSRASMAPELKLLFQLGGSAMMVHMTNTMFKSAMPNMDDILRQNPDLMRQFQSAAVNSMGQSNPGFSGFMNGIMNPEPQAPMGRGPPPPMATQGPNAMPPPSGRPGNNNMSRAADINVNMMRPPFAGSGINIRENEGQIGGDSFPQRTSRAEMKGPSDISDILSGLKTKKINIRQAASDNDNNSTISISDLKNIQNEMNMPKKSRRRPKSDKNTMSLDI